MQAQPRVIRLKDAPSYLGMDRSIFNTEVRPSLTEFPVGSQGIGFDRLELDAWFEHYKQCNGRPARRRNVWDEKERQASPSEVISGTSTRKSVDRGYAKALALIG